MKLKVALDPLQELNVSRTVCSSKVLKLLIDNNKHLMRLFKASLQLANALSEPINLQNLEQLRDLDMSFQGTWFLYTQLFLLKQYEMCTVYLNKKMYCLIQASLMIDTTVDIIFKFVRFSLEL